VSGDDAEAQGIPHLVALFTRSGVPMMRESEYRAIVRILKSKDELIDELVEALWGMVTSFHAVEYMEDHMKQSSARARAAIEKAKGKT
jgi:hypothetical protein